MNARKAMISKIHLAKKDLALQDETYRDILRLKTGKESAAELDDRQLDKVLKHFQHLGWAPKRRRSGMSKEAQIRMVRGVWADICALGIDAEDPDAALRAFVGRQTKTRINPLGVSDPEFLDSYGANKVLEGLKAWRSRLRRAAAQTEAA